MNNFDRIRIKSRKATGGSSWEVVKETHKAGEWDGPPATVEIIADRLTRSEADKRVKKERGKPTPPKNPYSGGGYSF